MKFLARTLAAFILCLVMASNSYAAREKIFTSNYPLYYFTEKITGQPKEIYFPEIDGDPAFWKPLVSEITKVQNSRAILLNGAGYEKWRPSVSLPKRKIVDTSKDFSNKFMKMATMKTHAHGPEGEHAHAGVAFTTWIDLSQGAMQAEAIKDALIKKKIGSEAELIKNYNALKEKLMALDKKISGLTKGYSEMPLIASHPVYDYFARRYNLNIKSVLWEPDSFPDEKMWRDLETHLKTHPAKWMIWEGEPLTESVQRLKEMGIESVVFDPCGNRPDEGDFMTVMEENIKSIGIIFKGRK